jgi:hypothetical protein
MINRRMDYQEIYNQLIANEEFPYNRCAFYKMKNRIGPVV